MKQFMLCLLALFSSVLLFAQKNQKKDMHKKISVLEEKMAIKSVVDEFSILADKKEIDKQVLLFTEDGEVETVSAGQPGSVLKGREQLKTAFSAFLSNFHTVYHQNGQQTITLKGNEAEATSYCMVILVGKQGEKEVKTTLYAIYKDHFVKEDGKWLIRHRRSNFVHRETAEL